MPSARRLPMLILAGVLAVGSQGGRAAGLDPADLEFWNAVKDSGNPAEYQAYLDAFPHGTFAALARIRTVHPPTPAAAPASAPAAADAAPAPAPAPAAIPLPAAAAAPDTADAADPAEPAPTLVLTPPNGRVGQRFTVTCRDFPDKNFTDHVIVVPAGSPVIPPGQMTDENRPLYDTSMFSCVANGALHDVGPFAPGKYEARWMTVLYNNLNKFEVKAATPFTVR